MKSLMLVTLFSSITFADRHGERVAYLISKAKMVRYRTSLEEKAKALNDLCPSNLPDSYIVMLNFFPHLKTSQSVQKSFKLAAMTKHFEKKKVHDGGKSMKIADLISKVKNEMTDIGCVEMNELCDWNLKIDKNLYVEISKAGMILAVAQSAGRTNSRPLLLCALAVNSSDRSGFPITFLGFFLVTLSCYLKLN